MEENQNEKTNEKTFEKTEKTAEEGKKEVEDLKAKTELLDKAIYEKRSTELKELEGKIDKKMRDYRELIEDAERQGVTTAGQKVEKVDPVKAKFDGEVKAIMSAVGR